MSTAIVIKPAKTKMQAWLRLANGTQRERLANLAGTSESYLYVLAGGHRSSPSAKLAVNLSHASMTLRKESRGLLPVITVEDLAFADGDGRVGDGE